MQVRILPGVLLEKADREQLSAVRKLADDQSEAERERTVRRVVKFEDRDVLMLDLLLVSPILEPVWKSRIRVEWEGRPLSLVSRDGLALMKTLAGRAQDLTDLKQLGLHPNE